MYRQVLIGCALLMVLSGCAASPTRTAPGADSTTATAPYRKITAAINGSPTALSADLTQTGPGMTEIDTLVRGGLTVTDLVGTLHPQLGEDVPTLDNGLWKLLPDGAMETTWQIRPGVTWHDGTPLTSEDLVFTLGVVRDRDIPLMGDPTFAQIDHVEAPDSQTITVYWNQPSISADQLFSTNGRSHNALPLPKHLLEQSYLHDKDNFIQLPYWTDQFVGAGPYRVSQFARDSHVTLQAFDGYVRGRPQIDEIEIRFLPDATSLLAAVLANTIDLMLGRGLSVEQGQTMQQQWTGGHIEFQATNVYTLYPEFIGSDPPLIGESAPFRRALYEAMNREEMVNTLTGGSAPIADTRILLKDPDYLEVESAVVKYGYDPQQAIATIQGLGYTRGPDGRFADPSGRPLNVEIRNGGGDYQTNPTLAIADAWTRIGVGVDPVMIPAQRARDLEYRATFPGFEFASGGVGVDQFKSLLSSNLPLPENQFTAASSRNYARYASPATDALIAQIFTTIPRSDRMVLARQMVHLVTDQVIWMPIYYGVVPTPISSRLHNVAAAEVNAGNSTWNVVQWELT